MNFSNTGVAVNNSDFGKGVVWCADGTCKIRTVELPTEAMYIPMQPNGTYACNDKKVKIASRPECPGECQKAVWIKKN